MLDLMWKYYDKQRNFTAAARILAKLAEKHRLKPLSCDLDCLYFVALFIMYTMAQEIQALIGCCESKVTR